MLALSTGWWGANLSREKSLKDLGHYLKQLLTPEERQAKGRSGVRSMIAGIKKRQERQRGIR